MNCHCTALCVEMISLVTSLYHVQGYQPQALSSLAMALVIYNLNSSVLV